MSQFFVNTGGGGGGGDVGGILGDKTGSTAAVGDPVNLFGEGSPTVTIENNDNGITVASGAAAGAADLAQIILTNRAVQDISTADDTPTTLYSFDMDLGGAGGTPRVFALTGHIVARNETSGTGGTYFFDFGVRSNGTLGTDLGVEFTNVFEDLDMEPTSIEIASDAGANFVIFTVTGLPGETIHWKIYLYFTAV
jgi:hypothetical protein